MIEITTMLLGSMIMSQEMIAFDHCWLKKCKVMVVHQNDACNANLLVGLD